MCPCSGSLYQVSIEASVFLVLNRADGLWTNIDHWVTVAEDYFHLSTYIACAMKSREIRHRPGFETAHDLVLRAWTYTDQIKPHSKLGNVFYGLSGSGIPRKSIQPELLLSYGTNEKTKR